MLNEAYTFLKGRIDTDVLYIVALSHSLTVSTLSTNVCLFVNQDPLQSEASMWEPAESYAYKCNT